MVLHNLNYFESKCYEPDMKFEQEFLPHLNEIDMLNFQLSWALQEGEIYNFISHNILSEIWYFTWATLFILFTVENQTVAEL